jgi:hypothetical protein
MAGANTNAAMPQGPTQYLIHEEGGLERWFNLTITNVGVEAVADYTCVAVNAGGVMEEAITLTFEEPEPVRPSFDPVLTQFYIRYQQNCGFVRKMCLENIHLVGCIL